MGIGRLVDLPEKIYISTNCRLAAVGTQVASQDLFLLFPGSGLPVLNSSFLGLAQHCDLNTPSSLVDVRDGVVDALAARHVVGVLALERAHLRVLLGLVPRLHDETLELAALDPELERLPRSHGVLRLQVSFVFIRV